jgi:hypothetical protein
MRHFAFVLLFFTVAGYAQQGPPPDYPKDAPYPPIPPCGEKGVPADQLCDDHGKIRNAPTTTTHQDLSDEEKAVINGTAPQPNPVAVPKSQPSSPSRMVKSAVPDIGTPEPIPTENTPTPVNTPPTNNDAEWHRVQQQKQSEYQAGYTAGQGIGTAIQNRLLLHEISKRCKHGAVTVGFTDGRIVDCAQWNAGERAITYPRSPAVTRQSAVNADQRSIEELERHTQQMTAESAAIALDTMEIKRNTIRKEEEGAKEGTFLGDKGYWQWEFRDWEHIRDTYCQFAPTGEYTDLEGNSTNCSAPPLTETQRSEILNRQLVRIAAGLMEEKSNEISKYTKEYPNPSVAELARKDWFKAQQSYCMAAPGGEYIDLDGNVATCPPIPPQGEQATTNGTSPVAENDTEKPQARQDSGPGVPDAVATTLKMMEVRRSDIDREKSLAKLSPSLADAMEGTLAINTRSWRELRDLFCAVEPGGQFTNLEGKTETCPR